MNPERLRRIMASQVSAGQPCIRGPRIRVTDVLELIANAAPFEEILADYPSLEREDLLAAVEYAAHQADHSVLQTS